MSDPGADSAFQRGVDTGEQPTDAVAEAGGPAGQVVVEPDQHLQFGQGVVADIDRAQRVRQRAGGSAMMNASRASVLARPGYRSAMRRIASPGR
jgi:hypothetical protein